MIPQSPNRPGVLLPLLEQLGRQLLHRRQPTLSGPARTLEIGADLRAILELDEEGAPTKGQGEDSHHEPAEARGTPSIRAPRARREAAFNGKLPPPPVLRLPEARNHTQALALLWDFETHMKDRLRQMHGTWEEVAELSGGRIEFGSAEDLAMTFPCALKVHAHRLGDRHSRPWLQDLARFTAQYPRAPARHDSPPTHGQYAQVPLLGGKVAIVSRANHEVLLSLDRIQWIPTGLYTDDVIEHAKLFMWMRICREAGRLASRLEQQDDRYVTHVLRG
ncbi:hypothetical protein GT347_18395 [Xylophilus rhododendri]|uniref:Uncharacterized protein n=1 Tax=Xylophilus rhododendri TaxID=2697032 RepID=A0A857J7E7_9BURK|nr:hypothetical protein [Xylophilus rhododendri]QHI99776.1 hypothetical protein GT347_18395 [Xylophilus rhododendri]